MWMGLAYFSRSFKAVLDLYSGGSLYYSFFLAFFFLSMMRGQSDCYFWLVGESC